MCEPQQCDQQAHRVPAANVSANYGMLVSVQETS